jgi:hypothetical protein
VGRWVTEGLVGVAGDSVLFSLLMDQRPVTRQLY